MFFETTSHRNRAKVERILGRHPQFFWKRDNRKGGVYFWLDDDNKAEIERVLSVGAKKCRDQKRESYLMCW